MTADEGDRVTGVIRRATALDDMSVRAGRVRCDTCGNDATGRIIDAYAAVFNQEAEITDDRGHYIEAIDQTAWNKRLADVARSKAGLRSVAVFYNHGMTLHGTPSEIGSHAVGHPMAIRTDAHGLITSTHYGTSDHAERTFRDVVDGNATGHSFTGQIYRSDPVRVPRRRVGEGLPRVRLLELGLTEYGPTPIPFYEGAQLVGQRAQILGAAPTDPDAAEAVDAAVAAGIDLDALAAETHRRVRRARLLGVIG